MQTTLKFLRVFEGSFNDVQTTCKLNYFWSHCALEVVEKVVLKVYMCANDIKIFKGIRGLF